LLYDLGVDSRKASEEACPIGSGEKKYPRDLAYMQAKPRGQGKSNRRGQGYRLGGSFAGGGRLLGLALVPTGA